MEILKGGCNAMATRKPDPKISKHTSQRRLIKHFFTYLSIFSVSNNYKVYKRNHNAVAAAITLNIKTNKNPLHRRSISHFLKYLFVCVCCLLVTISVIY